MGLRLSSLRFGLARPACPALISGATLFACFVGLVLPNALVLMGEAFGLGLPARTQAIAIYAIVVALAGSLSPVLLVAAFIAAIGFDLFSSVSKAFFLAQSDLFGMVHWSTVTTVLTSPVYATLACGFAAFTALNIFLLVKRRDLIMRSNRSVLLGLTLLAIGADAWANPWAHFAFDPIASVGQPFESAVEQSGFDQLPFAPTGEKRHDVLLILVESLGVLQDPGQRKILFAPLRSPDLMEKYVLTKGRTTFFGATAYGEVRELCHTRELNDIINGDTDPVCLPDHFHDNGYDTLSVHGFSDVIYDRSHWYPKLGFDRSLFKEGLDWAHMRRCSGPFAGPCDVDLARAISQRIEVAEQKEPRKPLFTYWLTLNTHVPVHIGNASARFGCKETGGGPFADAEVCSMAELWMDLFEAVRTLAVRHPSLEILLVGDHAPPLWRRNARDLFVPGQVPWIRLTPRSLVAQMNRSSG